jgi:two-component system chemotaxis response regulator CheB
MSTADSMTCGPSPDDGVEDNPTDFPVVVAMVCSAGGLEALLRVLEPLPHDFPAAVIVLQHMPPDRTSHMWQILRRCCALPVRLAEHGDQLRPGHVFVVPEGTHALVTAARSIALIVSGPTPPYRPSADLLLASLALSAGPRTIAVVLSGSGRDGATGATAVHDFGGTVIAADPVSCKYFEMPKATIERDDVVDFILPVDEIPELLQKLVDTRRDERT